jgi:hypothetical protein
MMLVSFVAFRPKLFLVSFFAKKFGFLMKKPFLNHWSNFDKTGSKDAKLYGLKISNDKLFC